jgi:hypothetical protein
VISLACPAAHAGIRERTVPFGDPVNVTDQSAPIL